MTFYVFLSCCTRFLEHCSITVVPTECDVIIVCRQHNDKEWKFKEQHAKMWENIAGAKRYSRPRGSYGRRVADSRLEMLPMRKSGALSRNL